MSKKAQLILTIALILAALVYTVYNYITGKTELMMLVVCCLILGWPLMNIIRGLIDELRNN